MPIRMVDDPGGPEDQFNDNNAGGRSGGGPGAGLLGLLPLLFSLFRGKRIFLLILILVGGYFILGRGGCNMSQLSSLATGGFLDPQQFAKANIYEPLADDDSKNPLPEAASLQKWAPDPGNQGQQGSCVAWSSAYAARSILEAARTGTNANQLRFSPSFLYNQIGLDGCQGSYIERAMEFMTKQGAVPYDAFPYDDKDCSRQPDMGLIREAEQYRMRGFTRLTVGDRNDQLDMRAIRENLSQGAPVVIGMMVGPSFMQPMMGKDVWEPEAGDEQMQGFGGHAMCVVGYDDSKYGGAFLLMNSWGPEWGHNGFAWVQYRYFKYFVKEAYGLEPMAPAGGAANKPFDCELGLVQVNFDGNKMQTAGYVQLRKTGEHVFETRSPLAMGTRFKMEVKNNTECYVYVFGKETDGTSYTLFPYPLQDDRTKTHYSPFCGITGYRLFPRDKSMQPDSIGTRDEMALIVSLEPLDWASLNESFSQHPEQDYAGRIEHVLGEKLSKEVSFSEDGKGTIHFTAAPAKDKLVACIVAINKN
ncbi:MAG TPA: C1 family peptidase [Chitinophagaceae bacterium]|nr:C1 family peptidase [Chitinophagaceae bacterium]